MMKLNPGIISVILLSALVTASCSSARKSKTASRPLQSLPAYAEQYISNYSELAVREMRRTGIPASITLAQGMLESDYGRSYLARKGNNHFGIKCHNGWSGEKIYHDDDRKGECFRKYRSVEESYRDHSDFLVTGSRYKDLFRLGNTDYRGWAHGLRRAGYATNPDYPALLIRKIDEYGLHYYDENPRAVRQAQKTENGENTRANEAVQETVVSPVTVPEPAEAVTYGTGRLKENNNVQYVVVRDGDTFESLAEEFQLLSWEIGRYNDLDSDASLRPGQIIYLQPKRSRAAAGLTTHTVREGETMYMISQKYAVKLSSLYKMNLMEEGTECTPGEKIKVR